MTTESLTGYAAEVLSVRKVAKNALAAGLSPIPIKPLDKVPADRWTLEQLQPMHLADVGRRFRNGCNIGLACGTGSGNLECLDFDDATLFRPFLDTVKSVNRALWAKLDSCWQETPSGGNHLLYRCSALVGGNQRLAVSKRYQDAEGNTKQDVLIETRGQGGQFLIAPSTAKPKHGGQPRPYTLHGSIDAIPTITAEDVELLHGIARSFDEGGDQAREQEHQAGSRPGDIAGDRPGDRYNQTTDWHTLLAGYGWRCLKTIGDREHWQRPGKTGPEASATLHPLRGFYCWSTSTPLPVQKPLDKFAVYTHMEHGGDFTAAARALAAEHAPAHHAGEQPPHPALAMALAAALDEPSQPANDWPAPLPIIRHEAPDPYPVGALPETIGNAVQEVVEFVQCPVAVAAGSALAVVSTVAQGFTNVQRAEGLDGPTSISSITVADSGERKSTVDNLLAAPLRQWEQEQEVAIKPVVDRYKADLAAWEAERDGLLLAIKDAKKRGKDTGDLKRQLRDLETTRPNRPKEPRLLFEDATAEALVNRLAHGWPVGGLLSNEGGAVLGGHSMRKETIMANLSLLNVLWDGGTRRQDRKTEAAGSYTVRCVRLTIGLAIQEETVRTFLDGTGALARGIGFLARFLFAWPESTQGTRLFREPPSSWPRLTRFHDRVRDLLAQPLPMTDDDILDPQLLKLSPEAKTAWIDFHDQVEVELRPGRDLAEARDVASKAADNVVRLAALFHLFEGDTGHHIGVEHINRASTIVTWHLHEARRFLGEIALTKEVRDAERLDTWLLEQCRAKDTNRVLRSTILTHGPGSTRNKRSLDAALAELREAGRIREIKEGRQHIVEVNPTLLAGGDHGVA